MIVTVMFLFLVVLVLVVGSWAVPATTTRQTPAGIKLDEGFPTKIAFERDPDVSFWEKTTKPPAMDNGEAIDTTTAFNTGAKTKASRYLIEWLNGNSQVAYDPNVYNNIRSNLIRRNGSITVHFPDGSKLDFFGYLKSFDPDPHAEGEFPMATVEFVVTNWDPANRLEQEPVLTSVSGT